MRKMSKSGFGGGVQKIENNSTTTIGMANPIFDSERRLNYLTWVLRPFFHIFTPSPRKMTSKLAQNGKNEILTKLGLEK